MGAAVPGCPLPVRPWACTLFGGGALPPEDKPAISWSRVTVVAAVVRCSMGNMAGGALGPLTFTLTPPAFCAAFVAAPSSWSSVIYSTCARITDVWVVEGCQLIPAQVVVGSQLGCPSSFVASDATVRRMDCTHAGANTMTPMMHATPAMGPRTQQGNNRQVHAAVLCVVSWDMGAC